MKLNEFYKNRINNIITEEYGISENLHNNIIPKYLDKLKNVLRNTDFSEINGFLKKTNNFKFDFFNDGKYNFTTHITAFYFKNQNEYEEYIKNKIIANGIIYKNKMFFLTIVYINNKLFKNDFYDTIGHEMEHLFQEILMDKEFSNQNIYNVARTYISSNNIYYRYLSWIIYASTKSEQEAMINGCYSSIINSETFDVNNIDKTIESSECGLWLKNLYTAYKFIKEHKNDENLYESIKKYSKFKDYYSYKYFLYIARNGIKNFEKRIGKLTLKLKKMFINEHLIIENNINDLLPYFLIKK